MHTKGTSENGMFGFPVPTVCGRMKRTVTWEKSWTKSFTHQLKDVIRYDAEKHGSWPEFEAAIEELINVVVPRLLDPLQANGRDLKPSLIHGDFWEKNIALDRNTGEIVVFDPGCVYGHNEMEFGTCKCFNLVTNA
jgi:protein-ribulosamine 3-kinase